MPSSAYRTVAQALSDPQLAHRGALAEVQDGGGTFKVMNLPFRMSQADVAAGKRAATLGEHTVAFLRETGHSEEEIAGFTGKSTGRSALTTWPHYSGGNSTAAWSRRRREMRGNVQPRAKGATAVFGKSMPSANNLRA